MRGSAKDHSLRHGERGLDVGQHQRGRAIRDRRAIGALQRARDLRVPVRDRPAEHVAEILPKVSERVLRAVSVVLGGDGGERVRLVAMALEIALRDQAEDSGETARDMGFLPDIGRFEQVFRDFRAARAGHFLDADDEYEAGIPGADRGHALMDRRAARGAGVLDIGCRREAHRIVELQRQRRGKGLLRQAARAADDDLVDVPGADARIGERRRRRFEHQRLDVGLGARAECRMAPTDDTCAHGPLPRTS